MKNILKKVLITEDQITKRVKEMAELINKDYAGKEIILVGLLKGSLPFMAELMKNITLDLQTEFMVVSSYEGGITSLGQIKIVKDLDISIENKHIIVVEDIVDSGLTLSTITTLLRHRMAASVEVACLLDKKCKRKVDVNVKYSGFEIPDEFVIGYGLDYDEHYRNLPFIGVVDTNLI